jgi:hypothetical protein
VLDECCDGCPSPGEDCYCGPATDAASSNHLKAASRSWDDATPDEIRDARIQSLEEGLQHLKDCLDTALRYGTVSPTTESGALAADILDEEWSK